VLKGRILDHTIEPGKGCNEQADRLGPRTGLAPSDTAIIRPTMRWRMKGWQIGERLMLDPGDSGRASYRARYVLCTRPAR
jgi:hypothetical protein